MELDQRFNLLKPGMKVIDVGAAPGGWSQVIAQRVESHPPNESVVAVDLLEILPVIYEVSLLQIDGAKFI